MVEKTNYCKERVSTMTPLLAIEEASRCLLCHDAPCSKACPAETDPAKFIRSLRFRNLKGAIATIRENNILGGVCSRVCPTHKYCEGACSRCGIDKPIQIANLQRYLTDYEAVTHFEVLEKPSCSKSAVAIIGSGPSGLAAATALAKEGFKVAVFEQREQLGGWLSYGIPPERLPQDVIDHEISYIKNLGVSFSTNKKLGKDFTLETLKNQGFKAVLLALGNQVTYLPEIQGIESIGVMSGTEFLAEAKSNNGNIKVNQSVVVIGGGDVAMDCAITAMRLGAKDVKIVYRRTLKEMPASPDEKAYILANNIPILTGFMPDRIISENGKVIGLEAIGMRDESKLYIPVDQIIFATGQKLEANTAISHLEHIEGYRSNSEGIFMAGDMIAEDKTVVYSIKQGKEAAQTIADYLASKEDVNNEN